jgi:nitroimidazol reductase NimA-like FMN-containing flavoprotein (pyridoxamine 5'-phosphate oxidase superfamily)
MIIRELTAQGSLDLLGRSRLGRLACAKDNEPYVVPLFFAYRDGFLYCSSTLGQKILWMRENPLVAVEVDRIESPQEWECVVVSGHYEELADVPEMKDKRQLAWSLLQKHEMWWEPGQAKTILGGAERPMVGVYFRIRIERMTGHRATPK